MQLEVSRIPFRYRIRNGGVRILDMAGSLIFDLLGCEVVHRIVTNPLIITVLSILGIDITAGLIYYLLHIYCT